MHRNVHSCHACLGMKTSIQGCKHPAKAATLTPHLKSTLCYQRRGDMTVRISYTNSSKDEIQQATSKSELFLILPSLLVPPKVDCHILEKFVKNFVVSYLWKVYCAVLIIYYTWYLFCLHHLVAVLLFDPGIYWVCSHLIKYSGQHMQWTSLSSITTKFTDNNIKHKSACSMQCYIKGQLQPLSIYLLFHAAHPCQVASVYSQMHTLLRGLSSPAYLWHQWSAG